MPENVNPPLTPALKNAYPFRLGTTSYILEDALAPNCAFLALAVDDIELVLFESDAISNLPDAATLDFLHGLKDQQQLSYTVHLPLDIQLGSLDAHERQASVAKCLRVIHRMQPLQPFAYIVHFHGQQRGRIPSPDIPAWLAALETSAQELARSGIDPRLLCVESLDYPLELIDPLITRYNLGICLDVGHVIFHGYDLETNLERYLPRSRVIHLHGNCQGMDHKAVSMLDSRLLDTLLKHPALIDGLERVLTLEVFGRADFEASLRVMQGYKKSPPVCTQQA